MKYILVLLTLGLVSSAFAKEPSLKDIYGGVFTGCTFVGDIDDGTADVTAALPINRLYSVFCYDSATFAGVACRVLQGGSAVDASSGEGATGEGELLFAGEKTMIWSSPGADFVSFEPLAAGTTQIGVACPRN